MIDKGLTRVVARSLLIKYAWNEDYVLEKINEKPHTSLLGFKENYGKPMPTTCPVCEFEDIAINEMLRIEDCNHAQCTECYASYLLDKFIQGFGCAETLCPDSKCGLYVP